MSIVFLKEITNKSQIKFLKEIVKLKEDNPEYSILFFVSNKTISEDCDCTKQDIWKVEVKLVYNDDEMFYIGEEDIREHFEYELDVNDSVDKDFDAIINEKLEKEAKNAIVVFLRA